MYVVRTRVLPSAFQCAVHFTASYVLYFLGWDCKTTNRYMNDLHAFAPITTVERRRQQRPFRAWQKFQQQYCCPRDSSSWAQSAAAMLRLQLCCGIGFMCEFQRLLPLTALVWRIKFVLRLVCDFGILRAERYSVILDFFFVILDVSQVISET